MRTDIAKASLAVLFLMAASFASANTAVVCRPPSHVRVSKERTFTEIILKTDDSRLVFSRISGFLTAWVVSGKTIIGEGGCLMPNFWCAVAGDDSIAGVHRQCGVWRTPKIILADISARKERAHGGMVVTAYYGIPETNTKMRMTYRYDGRSLEVTEQMVPADTRKSVPPLPRFGMVMQLPFVMTDWRYNGSGECESWHCVQAGGGLSIDVTPSYGMPFFVSTMQCGDANAPQEDSAMTGEQAMPGRSRLFIDGFNACVCAKDEGRGTAGGRQHRCMEVSGELSFSFSISTVATAKMPVR